MDSLALEGWVRIISMVDHNHWNGWVRTSSASGSDPLELSVRTASAHRWLVSIEEADLRRYIAAGIVQELRTIKAADGWLLQIQLQDELVPLQRQRGGPRVFKSLDKLAQMLERAGLSKFEVRIKAE